MYQRNVLVLANVTAASESLVQALVDLDARTPATFTLLVPAGSGREAAIATLEEALDRFTAAGLIATGEVGDPDPMIAVQEAYDPRRYDEIVVSTLPLGSSKWLHAGMPERIGILTGAPVTHVVSEPARPPHRTTPVPAQESIGPLLAPYAAVARAHSH